MTDPPTQCWFSLSIMGGEIWKWGGGGDMGSMTRRADMFSSFLCGFTVVGGIMFLDDFRSVEVEADASQDGGF